MFLDKSLLAYNENISLEHLFGDTLFCNFSRFAEYKTLTIPKEGKAHVFEKAVFIKARADQGEYYGPTPVTFKPTAKTKNTFFLFNSGHSNEDFYLLKGAVQIDYKYDRPYNDTTLTYIQIEP
ncbi:hypothetical protein [Helicobacter cynogastricus]|uniref:hypothetical protein n=1 Tax=Helicobacter cynogastricus TaxID=329937 RepID=UPI000CF16112|nr:hypothetical protein [Helicobacter cynogastricus]